MISNWDKEIDVAHIGPVELFTPKLEATRDFFVNLMAFEEVGRDENSIYLHAWDDYQAWTIRIIQREKAGPGRTFLRAKSPQHLKRAIDRLPIKEVRKDIRNLGEVHLFDDQDGHPFGIYWDAEWYVPSPEQKPSLKNQAAKFPGRGANVRRLDHINFLAKDVNAAGAFLEDVIGSRCSERIVKDDGSYGGAWYFFGSKSYDLVYTADWTGSNGRLHHLAFATDTREDILRAADVFLEAGIFIETGPHKHAIQQTFFLYVWEPGGNRIELCNPGARLLLAPDWKTIEWNMEERAKGQAWGLKTIESFHTHGTPLLD